MYLFRKLSIHGLLFGVTCFLWTAYLCPALGQDELEPTWANETGESTAPEPEETVVPIDEADIGRACALGESDAEKLHSTAGYMVGGFFCGIIGFAIAAAASPQPPADRIAGKSPEFVQVYTTCYEKKAKSRSVRAACGGWLMGAAASLLILSMQQASSI